MKRIGTNAGFVKLYRDLADSEFWLKERFTKAQAWIDLLMMAQGVSNVDWSEGKLKNFEAGTVYMPIEQLAERWKWNRRTVTHYLKTLAEKGMATTVSRKMVGTQIKIENWGTYQGKQESALHMEMHMERPSAAHETVHMDASDAEALQNKESDVFSDTELPCAMHKATQESACFKFTPNKERIKNNKEIYYGTFEGVLESDPRSASAPLDGGGSAGKERIPAEYRDKFDSYEAYYRWRNQ